MYMCILHTRHISIAVAPLAGDERKHGHTIVEWRGQGSLGRGPSNQCHSIEGNKITAAPLCLLDHLKLYFTPRAPLDRMSVTQRDGTRFKIDGPIT